MLLIFLKLPSGSWSSERNVIGNCFTNHFRNVFTSSIPILDDNLLSLFDTCISPAENDALYAIPSEQEIFTTLSDIGSTKAPGPDGFTAIFYKKKYWSTVKEVVLSSIWDFFGNHHLLKEQNHTFIALIPKQLGASSVHHFRPISLCNIISKILVNRFKGLLHHFISPYLSTFIPS